MWIFTRQKKPNSNENMLFWRKTDETIWKPPLSKRTSTFQLTPYFWAIFSWSPSLPKTRNSPPPLILGGRKLCGIPQHFVHCIEAMPKDRRAKLWQSTVLIAIVANRHVLFAINPYKNREHSRRKNLIPAFTKRLRPLSLM